MSDPTQPEATTTAARVLSDAEIVEIHRDMRRRDHINPMTPQDEERAILDALADWVPDLVAALDAAVTARRRAELLLKHTRAQRNASGKMLTAERERAERAEQFGAKRATDYERRLEQARLAEHELIGRLERAEAALAVERHTTTLLLGYILHVNECDECMPGSDCATEERLHQKLFGDPQASSQAAPHERAYSLSVAVRELPPLVIEDAPHEPPRQGDG